MIALLLGQVAFDLLLSTVILYRYIGRITASHWIAMHIPLVACSYVLSHLLLVLSLALRFYAPDSLMGLLSWMAFVMGDIGLLVMWYYQRRAH